MPISSLLKFVSTVKTDGVGGNGRWWRPTGRGFILVSCQGRTNHSEAQWLKTTTIIYFCFSSICNMGRTQWGLRIFALCNSVRRTLAGGEPASMSTLFVWLAS